MSTPKPLTYLQKILRLTFRNKSDVRVGAVLLLLMFVAAMFEAVGIGIVLPFVAFIAHPERVDENAGLAWVKHVSGATSRNEMVTVLGLGLLAVFVLKNAFMVFVQYAQQRFIFTRQIMLERHLVETYMRRPWVFHLQHNSSELIHNVTTEVALVFAHVVVSLFVLGVEGLSMLVIALLLVSLQPVVVPAVGLALGVISIGFYRTIQKRALAAGEEQRVIRADMLKTLQQGLGGVKEARLMGVEDFFIRAYSAQSTAFGRTLITHHMLGLLPRYILETTGILAVVLITIAMYMRGGDEATVLPIVGALAVAAVRVFPSTARVIGSVSIMRFMRPSVDALWKALEPYPGEGKHDVKRADVEPLQLEREIRLKNVEYTYPAAPAAALRGVSLTIRRGESIAFVGGSGAGKTTIVDVLIGLLDPARGSIEVDGEPLSGDRLVQWQRAIGYIPQTVYLSDDTIRRNIAFGMDDTAIDETRVKRAVEAAQLGELVESLPEGLDSWVGERGVRLSGGQRQRIGIARALYLDPKVLILDEATSSLDSVTERDIVEAIDRLKAERTVLVVAHRLSTVRSCDRLVFMDRGEVRDVGTWQELDGRSAGFQKLVALSGMDAEPRETPELAAAPAVGSAE